MKVPFLDLRSACLELKAEVGTLIHCLVPAHLGVSYVHLNKRARLYITEKLANKILSLPIGPYLSEKIQNEVIRNVQSFG